MGLKKLLDTNSLVAQRDIEIEGTLVDRHLDGVVVVDDDLAVEIEDTLGVGQHHLDLLALMRRGCNKSEIDGGSEDCADKALIR